MPQKLWPIDIFEKLEELIRARGDASAVLAAGILKNYQETDKAFRQQMKRKKWQYFDIVPLSAIWELVRNGKLPPDSSFKHLGVNNLCPEMVEHLLTYVVGRLHLYEDSYHLALLDDISDPTDEAVKLLARHLTEHFWTVKPGADGQLSLIVTEWPVDRQGQQRVVHRHIDNADIAKAFIETFAGVWRTMPATKLVTRIDEVTKLIAEQIEILK